MKDENQSCKHDLVMDHEGVLGRISFEMIFKLLDGKFESIVSRNQVILEV